MRLRCARSALLALTLGLSQIVVPTLTSTSSALSPKAAPPTLGTVTAPPTDTSASRAMGTAPMSGTTTMTPPPTSAATPTLSLSPTTVVTATPPLTTLPASATPTVSPHVPLALSPTITVTPTAPGATIPTVTMSRAEATPITAHAATKTSAFAVPRAFTTAVPTMTVLGLGARWTPTTTPAPINASHMRRTQAAPSSASMMGAGVLASADVAGAPTITTTARTGDAGYSGDGGAAPASRLNQPFGMTVDAAGDLFIADMANNVVREVIASTGVITTLYDLDADVMARVIIDQAAALTRSLMTPEQLLDKLERTHIARFARAVRTHLDADDGAVQRLS